MRLHRRMASRHKPKRHAKGCMMHGEGCFNQTAAMATKTAGSLICTMLNSPTELAAHDYQVFARENCNRDLHWSKCTPVVLSSADTFRMPLASMSKMTLIWGTPRGAGGIPDSSNLPSRLLSLVRDRSPSKTWMSTPGWLSEYVEKTCSFLVGMVVFRLIKVVCKHKDM